ncbi:MAG: hypothetical protein V4674_01610 [Patescibacteria group bacterium]
MISTRLRRHWAALIAALLMGLLYASFHFFIQKEVTALGREYEPAPAEGNLDEGYYALRAARAYAGEGRIGDINLVEYKGTPSFLPLANPHIFSLLAAALGSLDRAFIASDFLFSGIIFFLIYLIALEVGIPRGGATVFSFFFMIAPKFALFPSGGALPFFEPARALFFSRFDYPSLTYIFYALVLYLAARLAARKEEHVSVLLGIAAGFTFYTYLYDWVYLFGALILLVLFFSLQGERERALFFARAILIGLFVSIPYWINFVELVSLPSYTDLAERIGLEHGRFFRVAVVWPSYVRHLGLLLLLALSGHLRKEKNVLTFFAALLLPIFVLLNLQVITGFVPHPDHWQRTWLLPLGLAAALVLYEAYRAYRSAFSPLARPLLRTLGVCVITSSALYGIWVQRTLAHEQAAAFTRENSHAAAYEWLRANTPKDSVVGTLSSRTNDEIILHTNNKIYTPNGLHTVAPTAEIWERIRHAARLFDLSTEEFRALTQKQTLYFFTDLYHRDSSFNAYFRRTYREIPKEILEKESWLYESEKLNSYMPTYELDYLLIDDRTQLLEGKDEALSLWGKLVYTSDELSIYKSILE